MNRNDAPSLKRKKRRNSRNLFESMRQEINRAELFTDSRKQQKKTKKGSRAGAIFHGGIKAYLKSGLLKYATAHDFQDSLHSNYTFTTRQSFVVKNVPEEPKDVLSTLLQRTNYNLPIAAVCAKEYKSTLVLPDVPPAKERYFKKSLLRGTTNPERSHNQDNKSPTHIMSSKKSRKYVFLQNSRLKKAQRDLSANSRIENSHVEPSSSFLGPTNFLRKTIPALWNHENPLKVTTKEKFNKIFFSKVAVLNDLISSATILPPGPSSNKKALHLIKEKPDTELKKYVPLLPSLGPGKYRFVIFPGNNSQLVKKIVERRPWWVEMPLPYYRYQAANFRWQPFSNGFRFESLSPTSTTKQMFNHFEFHYELSKKSNLFSNLLMFSEQCKENVFNFLPVTFSFELHSEKSLAALPRLLQAFTSVFMALEANKGRFISHANDQACSSALSSIAKKMKNTRNLISGSMNGILLQYSKYTFPLCHFSGYNLWLLKPSGLNRGRGIHVFNSLETMKQIITESMCDKKKDGKGDEANSVSFVIQKYIECPLLINQRKFDIRAWVLITHLHEFYLFREGYIRTSSVPFMIDPEDVDNKFIHLTNNAIQKDSTSYGSYEDGNQLSFSSFQSYLNSTTSEPRPDFEKDILLPMKNVVKKSMYAIRKKLDSENRKYSFEIFGYDFILDADYNMWLIEVNTNPCLEESSELLKTILPRMIDDAFKLTLDLIFPPSTTDKLPVYPVRGYEDNQNMWERLGSFNDYSPTTLVPPASIRSEQVVCINEKGGVKITKGRK